MNTTHDPFKRANDLFRKSSHAQWHRLQSRQHILRSQLGFNEISSKRPDVCKGCVHYHGIAYGYSRATRTVLICGFHPSGWQCGGECPDWSGSL